MENFDKGNTFNRRNQGKRQLAVLETCKLELKKEIQLLFDTFSIALEKATQVLKILPPHARPRGYEATIIQGCFAEALIVNFGEQASYGKYKRLILKAKSYIILFKKLDRKGFPMNIKTGNVQGILSQKMTADLFAETEYNEEPILYFGYQVGALGHCENPQLVYIDDGKINFIISPDDNQMRIFTDATAPISPDPIVEVEPKLKDKEQIKKAI